MFHEAFDSIVNNKLLNAGFLLPNESYRLLNAIWDTLTSYNNHLRITSEEQSNQTIIAEVRCLKTVHGAEELSRIN